MAVDPRAKGKRAEYDIRDLLRKSTGLGWERVPGSGGFGSSHGLKGDVYLPPATGKLGTYTIEVKHYKEDALSSNVFRDSQANLGSWWAQTVRESMDMNNKPLLVFKHDRGQWIAAVRSTDFKDFAHIIKGVTLVLNKFEEPITLFLFNELVTNLPEHLYR